MFYVKIDVPYPPQQKGNDDISSFQQHLAGEEKRQEGRGTEEGRVSLVGSILIKSPDV
jgi:hypothetical protein